MGKLLRPFKVRIRARVTTEIDKEISPANVNMMHDAVRCAIDEFKGESKWDSLNIVDVTVSHNQP